MRTLCSSLFVILVMRLCAQVPTLHWAQALASTSVDHTYDIAIDATGAVISMGVYQTTLDLDPGPNTSNVTSVSSSADVYIRKVDANGALLWGGSIGGSGTDEGWALTLDAEGNVILVGRVAGTVDLDPTAGVFNVTTNGSGNDAFVVKLSSSGAFLWGRIFGGLNTDVAYGVATDAAGNIYTSGSIGAVADLDPGAGTTTLGGAGLNDAFVQKLDPNGLFIWARVIGGTANDVGWSVAATPGGEVCLAGEFRTTVDLDPGAGVQSATSAGDADIFVEKLDANGSMLWAFRCGGTSLERARAIAVDGTGACIFTGQINSATDMDPGTGDFTLPGDFTEDAYLTKINTAGQFEWAFIFNSFLNDGLSVAVDGGNNIYTAGSFGGTLDIDPGPGTTNLVGSAADGYVIRYRSSGALDWGFAATGTGNQNARAVAVGPDNSVAAGGTFIQTMDVEPGPGTTNLTAVNFNSDAWIARYAQTTPCANIAVQVKVILEGPYVEADQLMGDGLRTGGWLPLSEPYSALGLPPTTASPTTATVLAITGPQAIVDWVLVELRAEADPSVVVERRAALLQRDGDVVGEDGVSPVLFCAAAADYHVAVRHRNHLGVMTAAHLGLTGAPTSIDLTLAATPVFGTNARHEVNGVWTLWPGNVMPNALVSYTGSANDRDPILVRVGSTTPNNTVDGYWPEDVNLDATVKYTGSANDRDRILLTVGSTTPNATRAEQLP